MALDTDAAMILNANGELEANVYTEHLPNDETDSSMLENVSPDEPEPKNAGGWMHLEEFQQYLREEEEKWYSSRG